MEVDFEYIDPYEEKYDYFMRIEHLGRYFFARDILKGYTSVLDIACADGYGSKLLSSSINKVTGIDRNKDYLDIAKSKYQENNIIYEQKDLDKDEIGGIYDGIVCFETLEHLKYPSLFLNKMYKALDQDGIMILSVPNSTYEILENGQNKDSYHLHVFAFDKLIELIHDTGFEIEDVFGQSYINKIVNKEIKDYKLTNLQNDAKTIAYPNKEDIDKTYSYIFILKKIRGSKEN